jgi:hypothetical protein
MYSSRSARKARRRQASARRIQPRLTTSTGLSNLDGPVTPQQVDMMYKWLVGYGEVAQRALAPHLAPLVIGNVAQLFPDTEYDITLSYPPPNAPPHGTPLGFYVFTTGNLPESQAKPFTFTVTIKLENSPATTTINLYQETWYATNSGVGFFLMSDASLHDLYNAPSTLIFSYCDNVSYVPTTCRNYLLPIDWAVPPVVKFTWTSQIEPTDVGLRAFLLYAVPTVN